MAQSPWPFPDARCGGDGNHRVAVTSALVHLRRALAIMDDLAADEAMRFGPATRACHRVTEASHAIHLALVAVSECSETGNDHLGKERVGGRRPTPLATR